MIDRHLPPHIEGITKAWSPDMRECNRHIAMMLDGTDALDDYDRVMRPQVELYWRKVKDSGVVTRAVVDGVLRDMGGV